MSDKVTTLVRFKGTDGSAPGGSPFVDVAGDLFGTTSRGGASDDGTVFEITKTSGTYARTPTTLVSFNSTNGAYPTVGLFADAAGDLFGTTTYGGPNVDDGMVFEIAKTDGSYASTPTILASFNGTNGARPNGSLIADTTGDLFGTTASGAKNAGSVFEIAMTGGTYASTPTTLVSFNGADGDDPVDGLFVDAAGNLFGTTFGGGANYAGTVFEVARTGDGYASTPTTLVSFDPSDGSPYGRLIADVSGDLFGVTADGGAANDGTVFEIAKTGDSYASTPTTLANFNGTNGAGPSGGLIADANGDFFGTTDEGGANGVGTAFELVANGGSYALTTLVSFNGTDGYGPVAGLSFDAAGDLFGTTLYGGANFDDGTVFEIAAATTPLLWEPTQQELTDSLHASDSSYNGTVPTGFMPLLVPLHDAHDDADGFYAAAYKSDSDVIIAFEGTVADPSDAYGGGSLHADLLLALGSASDVVSDAETFASIAIALAEQQGYSTNEIFVTGHSLGGLEAEAVAENEYQQGVSLDGVTFGPQAFLIIAIPARGQT